MNKQEWLHNVVMGGIFLGMSNVYGLVTSDIDDTRKLKVTLSAKDTNRITIDNSRIAQVFGIEELMAIQFDEENGQCFVKAKTNPGHPVTLTLITEEGETQDLEITFADQSSEVVRMFKKGQFNSWLREKTVLEEARLIYRNFNVFVA